MEYIDVLDEKGNKTGEIKPKKEVHRDGDWHRASHVWLLNSKGELLLQYRSKNLRIFPDCWDISTAGHNSAREDSVQSGVREAKEEIGVTLDPESFQLIGSLKKQEVFLNDTYFDNEFNDIYLVKVDFKLSDFEMKDKEATKVKWIHWKELRKLINQGKINVASRPIEYEILFKALENK